MAGGGRVVDGRVVNGRLEEAKSCGVACGRLGGGWRGDVNVVAPVG